MTKKMTGKANTGSVADISAFIEAADPVSEAQNSPVERPKSEKAPKVPSVDKRGVGKPPMASEEVRSKTVQVKVTEAEYAALKAQAAGVPVSTFVRDQMKGKKII